MGRLRIDRLAAAASPLFIDGRPTGIARCHLADGPLARLVGLLGTPDLAQDEAVWLSPCGSIHTIGMRGPIGVAFVAADGTVLRVVPSLAPARAAGCRGAGAVVEFRPGALEPRVGDRLSLAPGAAQAMGARSARLMAPGVRCVRPS